MVAKKSISPGAGNYKGADEAYKKIGSSPLLKTKRHWIICLRIEIFDISIWSIKINKENKL